MAAYARAGGRENAAANAPFAGARTVGEARRVERLKGDRMLGSIDDRAVIWISTHRFAPLNDFFVALGTVEKLCAIWVLGAYAVGVALRWRGLPTVVLAVVTGLATLLADTVYFGVKEVIHRTRPFDARPAVHPLYTGHSSSSPAGHAATGFTGAVMRS